MTGQSTAVPEVNGYSAIQVTLHWAVVVLVAFQFLAHEGIEDAWRAYTRGDDSPSAENSTLTYLHIATGTLILLLALVRIYLRIVRGAPSPPADEPRFLQISAEATHRFIYLLLLLLPLSGATAWFFGLEEAGDVHELLKSLLLAAIVLHISGALFQHFIRRSDVLMRMFRPEKS